MSGRYGVLNDPADNSLPSCSDCGAYVDVNKLDAHDWLHDQIDQLLASCRI